MDTFNNVGVDTGVPGSNLPMTGPLVLPHDLKIVALATFSAETRSRLRGEDGDFVVTRPLSRIPSKVIDSSGARFLREFKEPTTLVEAILRLSKSLKRAPEELLEEIFPFLETCLSSKLLVEPGTNSETIKFSIHAGDVIAGCTIEECIHVLDDTEIYRVSGASCDGAIKLARNVSDSNRKALFEQEAAILRFLSGRVAPRLITSGQDEAGRAYLVTEWISGQLIGEAAAALRVSSPELTPSLARLCANVIEAYVALHEVGVIHSDVHPNNVLLGTDGAVRIIDYGYSRIDRSQTDHLSDRSPGRAGMGFYFEPEFAAAVLASSAPPASTRAGEQYAVAALVYFLLTGCNYLDFSLGKHDVLNEIVTLPPVPLFARGLAGLQPLEEVLFRALRKDPAARFPNIAAMAEAFRNATQASQLESPDNERLNASSRATPYSWFASAKSGSKQRPDEWLDSTLRVFSNPTVELPVASSRPSLISFTQGAIGIAAGLYRIACIREDADLFALAERWLDRGLHDLDENNAPQSAVRAASIQALISNSNGDLQTRSKATERFLAISRRVCDDCDDLTELSEFLLLSSQLLYVLRCDRSFDSAPILDLGDVIFDRLWRRVNARQSIAESGPNNLGMAHNTAGHLYSVLAWIEYTGTREPDDLRARLGEIAKTTHARRNHPSAASVGFSDGPACFVFLWTAAYRLFKDAYWLLRAEDSAKAVAARVLRARDLSVQDTHDSNCEDISLSSGLAGDAYALLNIYKHTGHSIWLDHAIAAAELAIECCRSTIHDNLGNISNLYDNNLGLAILVADLKHPRNAVMPFFEFEAWPFKTT